MVRKPAHMPKAPAGEAGSRSDDASRRHQHCCKNAFHDRCSSFCAAPRCALHNHPRTLTLNLPCFALTALALIRTSNRAMDERDSRHRGEQLAAPARLIVRRTGSRLAGASRPPSECQILNRGQKRSLPKLSVAVASERRARRGHGGCVCSLRERRDRNQRDQRESGDEFPHDTSPRLTLSCCLQRRHGGAPCLAVTAEIGSLGRSDKYISGLN